MTLRNLRVAPKMEMVNIPRFTRTKNDLKSTEKRAFKISGNWILYKTLEWV